MADDAFTGLKDDARKGVYFDATAATTMAQQAADMLQVVNMAHDVLQKAKPVTPLNQRTSGRQLADKFNAATDKLLNSVIGDHRDVLIEMGETFIAAGALYPGADRASAAAFTDKVLSDSFTSLPKGGQPGLAVSGLHVDSVSLPGWGQSNGGNVYSWSGTSKGDYDNKLTDTGLQKDLIAKVGKFALDTAPITPEPGAQYGWDDFHNHWQYIHDSTILGNLGDAAQDWNTASAYLKAQASAFQTAANRFLMGYQGSTTYMDQVWASDAAKKAKDGILKYLQSVQTLTDSMDLLSENFAFTEGWLKKLQNFLPYNSLSDTTVTIAAGCTVTTMPISQSDVDEAMTEMRQAWDNWYGEGCKDSSGAIPMMLSPKDAIALTPVKPGDPPAPGPGDVPQAPGSPSTPGSPGSPVTPDTPKVDGPTQPTDTQPTDTKPSDTNPTTTDTTQQTLQSLISQAGTVVQAGISAVEQGVEKIASAVQQGLQTNQPTTTKDPSDPTTQPQDDLTKQLQNLGLIPNGSPSGSPSGLPTGGVPSSPGGPTTTDPKSQLFPRSSAPTTAADTETDSSTTSRAGLATTSSTASTGTSGGMGGSPMAAGSQSGQGKEHKRPQYLTSLEHFEEVIGEAPAAVTPVAEK